MPDTGGGNPPPNLPWWRDPEVRQFITDEFGLDPDRVHRIIIDMEVGQPTRFHIQMFGVQIIRVIEAVVRDAMIRVYEDS